MPLLPRLPRRAADLHLRRAARADAAGQLGAHHPSRPAARSATASARAPPAAISPSSAASRRRSAPTAPSRSPRRAGMRLRIAAKVDNADLAYWQAEIEPLVRANPLVEYVGEIGERDKADFLGGASALLFPIDWPEPFGLVMIEAMACGTPVIAFRLRLRPRGGRPRRERLSRDLDRGGHRRRPSRPSSRPGAGARDLRAAFFHRAGGGRLPGGVFVALRQRPPAPPGQETCR